MSKQIIPNGSKVNTEDGVFEVINYDTGFDVYLCYQQGFDGHSGNGKYENKYLNTKYEGQCWWFSEEEVSLIEESKVINTKKPKFKAGDKVICTDKHTSARGVIYGKEYTIKNPSSHFGNYFGKTHNHVTLVEVESTPSEDSLELVKQQPKDYRRMKPTDLIDIVLDGNEFKVPLGDLIHTKGLIGGSTGGTDLYFVLKGVFDELGSIDGTYQLPETTGFQTEAFKTYFIDVEKEQQKKELEAEIVAKSNELLALQDKLKDLN